MVLEKGAVLEDDGTYTIQLSAYATGTTTSVPEKSGTPLDIVLVIDQSGSMAYNDNGNSTKNETERRMYKLKQAVTSFVNSISANAKEYQVEHRVAIAGYAANSTSGQSSGISGIGYNGSSTYWVNTGLYVNGEFKNYQSWEGGEWWDSWKDLTASDYQNALVAVNDSNGNVTASITAAISLLKASGGTFTEYGLKMAQNVFANNPIETGSNRKRIIVLFTDGETNSGINDVLTAANTLKSDTYNATVYSVGFGSSVNGDFLSHVSSNYKSSNYRWGEYNGTRVDTKYSMTAKNREELENIFENISQEIQNPSTTVTLNADSVMRDVLSDGFRLPDDYNTNANITIQTVKGTTTDSENFNFNYDPKLAEGMKVTVNGRNIDISGFNYSEKYIAPQHDGEKLIVTIRGVEATDAAITGKTVYTNEETSGIYATSDATSCISFPQPTTILKSKTYVLDYGKPVNLASQDWGIGSVTTLNGAGMYKFTPSEPQLSLTKTYGKVATATAKTGLTYTPTTMNWNGYDSFYVFGKQIEGGVINQWSKVTVMPANSVYYEDTFVTDANAGTVGIVYGGEWKTDGTDADRDQTLDSGHPYGWETGYAGDTGYSDGSAHKAVASAENKATASFTFTGTGVDVYSRTDLTTGTVAATLTKKVNGEQVGVKGLVVDNLAASAGENDAYYQIPTLFFDGLDYGEYTLTLYVTTAAEKRATYYLDGVRVYNPIQPKEEDAVVKEAYGAAGELGASFQSVREILLTAEDFDPTTNNTTDGVVFIDQDGTTTGTTTQVIGTYKEYGPKNEVYLAQGQSIAFKVSDPTANYYLGIKAPNGATTAKVTWEENAAALPVNAASDLYYQVTPNADGYILVKNTGENLLSVTKLRTTNGKEQASITTANVDDLLAYANTFDTLEEITYSTQPGEVEIENPEVNELGDGSIVRDWLEKIFKGIRDLLRP